MKGLFFFNMLVLFAVLCFCGHVMAKECTNIPTKLSSTLQGQLFDSGSKRKIHLTPTDNSAWSSLASSDVDRYSWDMLYHKMKNQAVFNVSTGFLQEVSLHDVRLGPNSIHSQAQQTNLEYLLMLDVDSLVWNFRKTAGLPTPGKPYGGWEDPSEELRGHFVGWFLNLLSRLLHHTCHKFLLLFLF